MRSLLSSEIACVVVLTLIDLPERRPLQMWRFEDAPVIRVGRATDNDVVISHSLISRHHLELRSPPEPNQPWQLVSTGRNGTFLNGLLTCGGPVRDGALIQLAHNGPLLQFQLEMKRSPSRRPRADSRGLAREAIAPSACRHSGNPPGNTFCIHCGYPVAPLMRLRHYQILRILGQGGMGTTYLAWDERRAIAAMHNPTEALVVLKEMNADMVRLTKARELFERESRVLQTLRHPGIPQFFEFFAEGDRQYLTMELIPGQDLDTWIQRHGPVSLPLALDWIVQVGWILDYLHCLNPPVIHRDIKPANLMLRHRDRRIFLLDFGAVKESGTPWATRIGAEHYSAPEQTQGKPRTQSDLYALGTTLVFLLTGKSPRTFCRDEGTGYRLRAEEIPGFSPQLQSVLMCLTEPDPRQRYQTAREAIGALQACRESG